MHLAGHIGQTMGTPHFLQVVPLELEAAGTHHLDQLAPAVLPASHSDGLVQINHLTRNRKTIGTNKAIGMSTGLIMGLKQGTSDSWNFPFLRFRENVCNCLTLCKPKSAIFATFRPAAASYCSRMLSDFLSSYFPDQVRADGTTTY